MSRVYSCTSAVESQLTFMHARGRGRADHSAEGAVAQLVKAPADHRDAAASGSQYAGVDLCGIVVTSVHESDRFSFDLTWLGVLYSVLRETCHKVADKQIDVHDAMSALHDQ